MAEKEKPFMGSPEKKMTHREKVRVYTGRKTEGRKMTDEEWKAFTTLLQERQAEAKRTGDWSWFVGQDTDTPPLIL